MIVSMMLIDRRNEKILLNDGLARLKVYVYKNNECLVGDEL